MDREGRAIRGDSPAVHHCASAGEITVLDEERAALLERGSARDAGPAGGGETLLVDGRPVADIRQPHFQVRRKTTL